MESASGERERAREHDSWVRPTANNTPAHVTPKLVRRSFGEEGRKEDDTERQGARVRGKGGGRGCKRKAQVASRHKGSEGQLVVCGLSRVVTRGWSWVVSYHSGLVGLSARVQFPGDPVLALSFLVSSFFNNHHQGPQGIKDSNPHRLIPNPIPISPLPLPLPLPLATHVTRPEQQSVQASMAIPKPLYALRSAPLLRSALRYQDPVPKYRCAYHSSSDQAVPLPFPAAESAILSAALSHVPTHGFTATALSHGARDVGYLDASLNLFPTGAFALVHYHLVTKRHAMAQDRCSEVSPPSIAAEIRRLTWKRLHANTPLIHRWQEVRPRFRNNIVVYLVLLSSGFSPSLAVAHLFF